MVQQAVFKPNGPGSRHYENFCNSASENVHREALPRIYMILKEKPEKKIGARKIWVPRWPFNGHLPSNPKMRSILIQETSHSVCVVRRSPIVHESKTLLFYRMHHPFLLASV